MGSAERMLLKKFLLLVSLLLLLLFSQSKILWGPNPVLCLVRAVGFLVI